MENVIMNAADSIAGSLAQCYVEIGNDSYNFMQMIDFEASIEKEKTEVPILGKTGKGHKSVGWKGSFKGTAHYNQSVFRRMLEGYKKTGQDTYFEIHIVNQDPQVLDDDADSKNGSMKCQRVVLKGCNIDGGMLAKFDAKAEYLDEEISGTFEDFDILEPFDELDGFKRNK
ncbi:MAG: phage tail tube protein [Oscillospiraceae bacterium]|nr:phage tail tube protein [Oscillospiraceae bacterium]